MTQFGTPGGRNGHSVIEAHKQAELAAAAGVVATVLLVPTPIPGGPVKVIGRDEAGNCTFYTEVPAGDVDTLCDTLGRNEDRTALLHALQDDGHELADAIAMASALDA